jgi:predicted ATPase
MASALAVEHGFSFWQAGANVLGGWATFACGKAEAGAEQLRAGFIDWLATDSVTYQTYYLGLLAEVLYAQGQVREPLRLLEEALALAQQTGEGLYEAELYRLRGEFMARDKSEAEARAHSAETNFHKALDIARRQAAKSLELRAAMSLARLYRQQNRQSEIQPTLAECYHWFTEGFDTPDLQEARILLEQIS